MTARIFAAIAAFWLAATAPAAAAGPLGIGATWTGFHAGINAGYGWGDASGTVMAGATSLSARDQFGGWLAGVQAGFDWQMSNIVVGAVADIQASTQSSQSLLCTAAACGYALTATNSMPWFGTLRGRAGIALDRFLVYATAGLSYAEYRSDLTSQIGGAIAVVPLYSMQRGGVVFGAGVEMAAFGNWRARAEYLRIDSGTITQAATVPFVGAVTASGNITDNILRTGLSYKFF